MGSATGAPFLIQAPVILANLGPGVKFSDSLRAEELALEALCSHPLQAGGRAHNHRSMCIIGNQGEYLGEMPGRGCDTESVAESEVSTGPEANSDSPESDADDRVVVEGIWEQLGLPESGEIHGEGAGDSGDSGGSADHELYGAVTEGYGFEVYNFGRGQWPPVLSCLLFVSRTLGGCLAWVRGRGRGQGGGVQGWFACICQTGSPLAGGPGEILHHRPPESTLSESLPTEQYHTTITTHAAFSEK